MDGLELQNIILKGIIGIIQIIMAIDFLQNLDSPG